MKKLLIGNLILAALTMGGIAFAEGGGVGSGGGGTTIPNPTNPEFISGTASEYGAKLLTVWLQHQEEVFNRYGENEQAKSPFFKVFRPSNRKNIYQLVESTEVEFRMSGPCLDSEGQPWDGSIYGSKPGSICISPFSMAPKLSDMNYEAETLALLAHEISHLMGTSESEAREIQQVAIWDFSKTDVVGAAVRIDMMATPKFGMTGPSPVSLILTQLGLTKELAQVNRASVSDISDIDHEMLDLRKSLESDFRRLLFINTARFERLTPNFVRTDVARNYLCSTNAGEDEQIRRICADRLDKGFAGETTVPAGKYLSRADGMDPKLFEKEYNEITVTRPNSQADLVGDLSGVEEYFRQVQGELDHLRDLQLKGYRTK